MAAKTSIPLVSGGLPTVGLFRWSQFSPFVGVSREKWRLMVKAGKAPSPVKLSHGCTVWKAEELHRWLADPVGFVAGECQQGQEA